VYARRTRYTHGVSHRVPCVRTASGTRIWRPRKLCSASSLVPSEGKERGLVSWRTCRSQTLYIHTPIPVVYTVCTCGVGLREARACTWTPLPVTLPMHHMVKHSETIMHTWTPLPVTDTLPGSNTVLMLALGPLPLTPVGGSSCHTGPIRRAIRKQGTCAFGTGCRGARLLDG